MVAGCFIDVALGLFRFHQPPMFSIRSQSQSHEDTFHQGSQDSFGIGQGTQVTVTLSGEIEEAVIYEVKEAFVKKQIER